MNKQENDLPVYDDEKAVEFILDQLPAEAKEHINEDTIEYILDAIYDYYDKNGLIDEDSAEEASIDEEAMYKFVKKAAKTDKVEISDDDILLILEGEYQYGKSIGVYTEETEE
jgi:hypothetical protein